MNTNVENNLVKRVKNGEAAALSDLFKLYWRAARAVAFGVTGNFDTAEDAAAEGFYLAFRDIKNLKDTSKFGPWLRTIVIRSAKHIIQNKTPPKKEYSEISSKKVISSSISDIEKRELSVLIGEAISNLDGILREAISLYYFEGYKIEQIADFLNLPIGTVKRRLHDGRIALRDSAEKIIEGKKPVNSKRENIIRNLGDFLEKGGNSDDFQNIMWQAMKLRPVPYELLRKIFSKHSPIARKLTDLHERKKYELRVRKAMKILHKPSPEINDSNHPVGKVMNDIKSALPEFKEYNVNTNVIAENIIKLHTTGDLNSSSSLPPGFAQGIPGAFISYARQSLFEKEDGSIYTMYELDWPKDRNHIKGSPHVSEALYLTWLRTEKIELRFIEDFLRNLVLNVIPEAKCSFTPVNGPHFSTGLRMNFNNISIPAATGGISSVWPGLPEGVSVASVLIYLEAWTSIQSGCNIGPKNVKSFLEKLSKEEKSDSNGSDR